VSLETGGSAGALLQLTNSSTAPRSAVKAHIVAQNAERRIEPPRMLIAGKSGPILAFLVRSNTSEYHFCR